MINYKALFILVIAISNHLFAFSCNHRCIVNNKDTINRKDKKGNKYGYWIEEVKYEKYYETDSTVVLIEKGFYKDNLKNGLWKFYYNGTSKLASEVVYVDGKIDSLMVNYYPNGNMRSYYTYSKYYNTKLSLSYHSNGQIIDSLVLKNGKTTSVIYYDNGERERYWEKEDKNPNWTMYKYWENGNLYEVVNYKNNVENGVQTRYYENGNIRYSCTVIDDKLDGEYKEYFESGELKKTTFYKNGVLIDK